MDSDAAHLIERAFQIARSGDCTTMECVKRQLRGEGYSSVEAHFGGASFRKQLRDIMLSGAS